MCNSDTGHVIQSGMHESNLSYNEHLKNVPISKQLWSINLSKIGDREFSGRTAFEEMGQQIIDAMMEHVLYNQAQ